jgi:hypothetical protein
MAFILTIIQLFTFLPTQQILFPVDDYGKYRFQEVVEVPGMNKEKLFENGQAFIKKIKVMDSKKKYFMSDDSTFTLSNKGSFYVYQYGSVNKAIDGAVEYDITVEIKDDKYRYTITNFIFNEYKRNRYGKFEPVSGKSMPLEAEVSGMNKKSWEKNRQVVYDKTQELIQNLYGEMIYTEKKATKKVNKENNW